MIISRTPVRISFFGGGTDYPDYYHSYGGKILSTCIDKCSYISVKELDNIFNYRYKISYSIQEIVKDTEEIKHPSIRECIKYMKIDTPLEIHYVGDLPARTGLGSSSSFTVGFLNCLHALKGEQVSARKLAEEAVFVEQQLIGEKVGVQDQYASAFGGLNIIDIHSDDKIDIKPLPASKIKIEELEKNLLLFYTGISRYSQDILDEQMDNIKQKINIDGLHEIKAVVQEGFDIICKSTDICEFGKLLDKTWKLKRSLSSKISNSIIDSMYEKAIHAGALGGKLLGAGGGGFLLLFVEKKNQEKVTKVLSDYPIIKFKFSQEGSKIIFAL